MTNWRCLRVSADVRQLTGGLRQADYLLPYKGPRGGSAGVGRGGGTKVTSPAAIPLLESRDPPVLQMSSGWARQDAAQNRLLRGPRAQDIATPRAAQIACYGYVRASDVLVPSCVGVSPENWA